MTAALSSWSFDPWLAAALLGAAVVYTRGSASWRRRGRGWRLASFLAGLASIWVALESPLESFASLLLSAHMGQHLLLAMVAPPLLLLAEPMVPVLRGLPRVVRREWLSPFLAWPWMRRTARRLVHPLVAGPIFVASMTLWHVPPLYELALRSPAWHMAEHACFFLAGVLFWWPVIQPAPSRPWWPRWAMVPYLLVADLFNTVLSAALCFSASPLYPSYRIAGRALDVDALADQARAGALMWIPGSLIFLVPAAWIVARTLQPRGLVASSRQGADRRGADARARRGSPGPIPLPQLASASRSHRREPFDLLRLPVIGTLLSRRRVRTGIRAVMLLGAAALVVDGITGPAEAPMNLAGTLPWTHWRGATVLLLLVGGNALCMACPFVLPRMGARWIRRRRSPSRSSRAPRPQGIHRRKWIAVALLVTWLVAYEAFDLWSSPFATAMLVIGYFAAAILVDSIASSGAFCKWACPLGQFHFAQSTLSPLTVSVRDPGVCSACRTHDCIRGNDQRDGCALDLFLPRKEGNLDCTFCLDCADACPHGNVGLLASSVGGELRHDRWRSSIGRPSGRPDLAVLLLVLSVGAVVNAAAMTAPVLDLVVTLAHEVPMPRWCAAALLVVASVGASIGLFALAARPGREWTARFAALGLAAVPLGAAMWLVHFSFHAVTSWRSAWPVTVRAAGDLGVTNSAPSWGAACCSSPPAWLLPAELSALSVGLALSIWTLSRRRPGGVPLALGALLLIALWGAAAWVLFQPMEMRGTLGWEVTP